MFSEIGKSEYQELSETDFFAGGGDGPSVSPNKDISDNSATSENDEEMESSFEKSRRCSELQERLLEMVVTEEGSEFSDKCKGQPETHPTGVKITREQLQKALIEVTKSYSLRD